MTDRPPYAVEFSNRAKAEIKRLDHSIVRQIREKLYRLAAHADSVEHEALSGKWSGYFRLRVRDYRIIYLLNHQARLIEVAIIGHRSDVYKR